jgi:CRP/FNR family transcriptional regulator, cyclic AMP receptor protein
MPDHAIAPIRPASRVASGLLMTEDKSLVPGPKSLLQDLSPGELARVVSRAHRKSYRAGATIFEQGVQHDGIFIIESGCVRVFYTSASGREITLAYWNPGNFVGGPDVLNGGTHMWSGVTVAETEVLMLPSRELRQLVLEIPALAIGLIEGLSFKGKCYSALAQILGTRSVTERLAHLLLQLAEIYGRPTKNGIFIDAAFTHVDLAHIVGATRQWVTMMLKRLQSYGAITCSRGQIYVVDRAILMALETKS